MMRFLIIGDGTFQSHRFNSMQQEQEIRRSMMNVENDNDDDEMVGEGYSGGLNISTILGA